MSEVAIDIRNISKVYSIGTKYSFSIGEAFSNLFKSNKSNLLSNEFWALKDVSFKIKKGDVVGIIGKNGAGKSTLLKVLSRITKPTKGEIDIDGRIASLLEVGTGFHPELTGRENIFLNGSILGMKKAEIKNKFDEIVDFSGIEKFIDTPVKRYSSGMYVRLAFSVAAHLEADILMIDEVLAVGDIEFQKKCLGKMGQVSKSGKTILFVSHNMGAINELCNKGILLEQGKLTAEGNIQEIAAKYVTNINISGGGVNHSSLKDNTNEFCKIESISAHKENGKISYEYDIHDLITINFQYFLKDKISNFDIAVILARYGVDLFFTIDTDQIIIEKRESGKYEIQLKIPGSFLKEGSYSISIYFRNIFDGSFYNFYKDILTFEVNALTSNTITKGYYKERQGYVIFPGKWTMQKI